MSKRKYYYAVVDKENGSLKDSGTERVPIFYCKSDAQRLLSFPRKLKVIKLKVDDIEDLILKS